MFDTLKDVWTQDVKPAGTRTGRFLVALTIGVTLMGGLVQAPVARAQEAEYETNMKQATLFIKKGWYRDAVKELRRAISTEQGRKSFEAHLLLAQTCFKEYDIGCAITYSEKARGLTRTPDEKQKAEGMMEYLANNFGKVEFQAGDNELNEGYLELKPKEPLLDKDVKAYVKDKVEPLADQRRTLPWIMYLPAIEWELHGQSFTVEGGKEIVQTAGFNAENAKPKPMKAPPPPDFKGIGLAAQLRVGAGVNVLNADSLNLGPVADVSVHKILGDTLSVGAFSRLNLVPLEPLEGGSGSTSFVPVQAGIVATYFQELSRSVLLTPAVGYGAGGGAVKEYSDCKVEVREGSEVFVCGGGGEGNTARVNTLTHGPLIRLEAAYQKRNKSSILMGQLGIQAQYAVSSLSELPSNIVVEDTGALGRSLRLDFLAGVNMTF